MSSSLSITLEPVPRSSYCYGNRRYDRNMSVQKVRHTRCMAFRKPSPVVRVAESQR